MGQITDRLSQESTETDANVDEAVGGLFQQINAAFEALSDWVSTNEAEAIAALGSLVVIYIALMAARMGIGLLIKRFSSGDPNALPAIIARVIAKISTPFLLVVALIFTALTYNLPERVDALMNALLVLAVIVQSAILAQEVAVSLLQRKAARTDSKDSAISSAVAVLKWLIIGAIWIIAFIVILDTSGVQVTALIAGLGIGGIAIGLAAQGIFSDLFASISILFDKPFKKGDFIVFGEVKGDVEEIGLRTTRIRSLSGEQISVSNTDLISQRIQNFKRLERRRHLMMVGVIYQTPADVIEQIPGWIREDIETIDKLDVDRIHFHGFGDFSLNFEIVFYANVHEFPDFMDVRQEANLAIMKRFEKEGVEFAYPTQTLYMQGTTSETRDQDKQSE